METLKAFFAPKDGRFHLALYELDDIELEGLVMDKAEQISLVLSNTGLGKGEGEDGNDDGVGGGGEVWDARNAPARARLIARAAVAGTRFELQHRMFNNATQIGHNKFAVRVDADGTARSVITGSTNWTWSGLTGQSNNLIRIDDEAVASAYLAYWERLKADPIDVPEPLGRPQPAAVQGPAIRAADATPVRVALDGTTSTEIWFSPNMKERKYGADPATPPDLGSVFGLMRKAQRAILLLAFYPSRQGRRSIIEEAVRLGISDPSLLVVGAVSTPDAMFNFRPKSKAVDGSVIPAESPFTYRKNRISVVRAAALTDEGVLAPFGDFKKEFLKVGNAIIHDKIVVIDPLDPVNCTVVFGSHNLGYKASYSNDENLMVVRGHASLAQAYAVHVLDVYDHYRFRAATAEAKTQGKTGWDGFLDRSDGWQDHSDRTVSDYFAG